MARGLKNKKTVILQRQKEEIAHRVWFLLHVQEQKAKSVFKGGNCNHKTGKYLCES